MSKGKIIGIIFIILIIMVIVVLGCSFAWYNSNLKPLNSSKDGIRVEIPEGTGVSKIANILEENEIIRNATAFKIYCRFNNITKLQAGKYELIPGESVAVIAEHIANGDVASDEVTITFIEGKNIDWYAKEIAKKTNNTEQDVYNLLEDEAYIDSLIEKYWFLKDEIKDDRIYYPLEGYLLPDTYTFENEDVSVKTIFNVILNYMDKYLSTKKDEFKYTYHQTLTLASLAELEGKSLEDRKEIIGVFFNRIAEKMSLGSDVTAYYAFRVNMAESNLTKEQLNTYNPYNTRYPGLEMAGKLPVGPICNPSKDAIEAALAPTQTDALYFVADKNGKVYFTKSNDEHNAKIAELKKEGLWFTY